MLALTAIQRADIVCTVCQLNSAPAATSFTHTNDHFSGVTDGFQRTSNRLLDRSLMSRLRMARAVS